MRKRGKAVLVRLNEQEHAHLKRLSETSGLKMEPLIRQLILGRDIKPRPPENLAALLRQMSAMGNNINQIAKVINSIHTVQKDDIEQIQEMQADIQKMQSELWQAIRDL
ncbi:plasmid mobilization relaxosome protein MobC [Intestinimonas sp. MSJ-38]|uniref:plasmid mobilization protein n=1 Tax=Intestinimonas sp. MSJ-38 TaxID=2841532 RepID=UPI001C113817|nr:plasmid mobilization relaxosome protein MobC [Intestinimonas sp. MSJ-38]MBU5433937.1 MobC family plasmid mobilization relaxosome protein [Intestinimonas sp. MSJ-38]